MSRVIALFGRRTLRAYAAALAIVAAAISCAAAGIWVFRIESPPGSSVWSAIVSDRWTMGFVRVAIVAFGLYAAASIAALIATGRWIRAMSTMGFESDDPRIVDERFERLQARLRGAEEQRDQAFRLLEEYLRG